MSETKTANKKYIAKLKNVDTKYGVMQKVEITNYSPTNKDGSPNSYFKGQLFYVDAESGKTFQVKQLGISVPKDGMSPKELEFGFVANITLDLNDTYQVTPIE